MSEATDIVIPKPKTGRILFFDTETTGLTHHNLSICDPQQPWPVSLSVIVVDQEWNILEDWYEIIKLPNGVTCDPGAERVHGITADKIEKGIEATKALEKFYASVSTVDAYSAYNLPFDDIVMRALQCRSLPDDHDLKRVDLYAGSSGFCAMQFAVRFFHAIRQLPLSVPRLKLMQAYSRVYGHKFSDAHHARSDTLAAMLVVKKLSELARTVPKPGVLEDADEAAA